MRSPEQMYDRAFQRSRRIRDCLANPEYGVANGERAALEAEAVQLERFVAEHPELHAANPHLPEVIPVAVDAG